MGRRVAIVGAGYAGMACAVTLADRGVPVTVYESGPVPGGRARRVVVQGEALDNGQHVLVGAYAELCGLVQRVGVPGESLLRMPLELRYARGFALRALRLPAPLGLLGGVLAARGERPGDGHPLLLTSGKLHRPVPAPVFQVHQLERRAKAHILVAFLSYALWVTLKHLLIRKGSDVSPAKALMLLSTLVSADIVLPTTDGREIHLRRVTTPSTEQKQLLDQLGVAVPNRLSFDQECSADSALA